MKKILLPIMIFLLTTSLMSAQKVGINKATPTFTFDITQPAGVNLSNIPLMNIEYTGTNSADVIGIRSKSKPADYFGIGGDFEGGYIGVQGKILGGLNQSYFGLRGDVAGSGAGNFFGAYGYAHGSGINYGVYGIATGGTKNWAGYFANGNVFIQNKLAISNTNPQHPVHINQPTGTTIGENFPVMHVEYTGNNMADVIAIQGRCVISSSYGVGGQFEGGHKGVVGKVTTSDGGTHFGVQGIVSSTTGTNVGIFGSVSGHQLNDYAGYFGNGNVFIEDELGIGRDPETNRLEVNGNASKSTAGDWLANSDARLKKNIIPLKPEEMIQKMLALQGITYEWNDDQTGTKRPEGIQYGFTAQNIQEVFPALVEEDARGYLQTPYGTYDAMMVEAIRYLYDEIKMLREELAMAKVK
jgi:hypothetical protein